MSALAPAASAASKPSSTTPAVTKPSSKKEQTNSAATAVATSAAACLSESAAAIAAGQSLTKAMDVEKVRTELAEASVLTMKAISKSNRDRINGVVKNGLMGGVHYRVQYFQAITKKESELKDKAKDACRARKEKMIEKGMFLYGLVTSEFFEHIKHPNPNKFGKTLIADHYQLLPGKSASDALDALQKGPTFAGCGEAMQIAHLVALRTVFKKPKFDALFGTKEFPMLIGMGTSEEESATEKDYVKIKRRNPLNVLMHVVHHTDISQVKRGQGVYVESVNLYSSKHYFGMGVGYNLICSEEGPNPKFEGLGLPEGVTFDAAAEDLRKEYNADSIDMYSLAPKDVVDPIMKDISLTQQNLHATLNKKPTKPTDLDLTQLDSRRFKQLGGGKFEGDYSRDFAVDDIAYLAALTIEQAKSEFMQWCVEFSQRK